MRVLDGDLASEPRVDGVYTPTRLDPLGFKINGLYL